MTRKRRWIPKEKRPVATVTGSHDKTIVYGVLSLDGKQLFRQDEKFDSQSFMAYLEQVKRKFKKFVMFVDRATQHRSKIVEGYLQKNTKNIQIEYFPVGSSELNAVEECWRQGKCNILSKNYYSGLSHIKQAISSYYRTRRFNLDIKKYLFRSTN
jgi:transposase